MSNLNFNHPPPHAPASTHRANPDLGSGTYRYDTKCSIRVVQAMQHTSRQHVDHADDVQTRDASALQEIEHEMGIPSDIALSHPYSPATLPPTVTTPGQGPVLAEDQGGALCPDAAVPLGREAEGAAASTAS